MKCLVAAGVPACGLTLDRKSFAGEGEVDKVHKVGLVYAGALNLGCPSLKNATSTQQNLHKRVADSALLAQYYGALKTVADLRL